MKISSKKIITSKRDFEIKSNKKNADSSLRKHYAREEFEIIEYVKTDNKFKYAIITPILKKRNTDCRLLFNISSLSSHFYLRSA
jgi:hypothetical protein